MSVCSLIEDAGYTVIAFETADAAWDWLRTPPSALPWVLVTDVRMPGRMNGLQLAQVVQAELPLMRVIITSGHMAMLPADLSPKTAVFSKPYSPYTLLSALRMIAREIGQDGIMTGAVAGGTRA